MGPASPAPLPYREIGYGVSYDDLMNGAKRLAWGTSFVALAALALAWSGGPDVPDFPTFLFWVVLLLTAELLPVSLGFETRVTMSFPLTIAIAVLFEPAIAMTMTALGAFDSREIRGEVPPWRGMFNRSQLVLAVGGAAAVLRLLSEGSPFTFPAGALALALAVLVHLVINLGLVTAMLHVDRSLPVGEALRNLVPKPVAGFLLTQGVLGCLGVASAAVYREIGVFVVAFLIPLLFARLSLLGARGQQELAKQVQDHQTALLQATERVFQEREQERQRIAENIHDSSLQLLVGASYAAANSLRYLEEGRIQDARSALSSSKDAMDDAVVDLRSSLSDLRRASIEDGGLLATIRTYADQMSTLWSADITIEGHTEKEPPMPVSLAAFQILQEGLVNALKHASRSVTIRISEHDGMVRISVEDRGRGFTPEATGPTEHMGISLMRERAARVGGRVEFHRAEGGGTRLEAVLPGSAAP